MFADTDLTDLDKWDMIGNHFGVGTIFALLFLLFFVLTSTYVLKASFGKSGFIRDFFGGVKSAAEEFLSRLTQTLDRLETAANESKEYHRQQATTCQTLYHAHLDPDGPCNPAELRAAAVHGLEAIGKIGDKLNADTARDIAAAKEKLIA